MSQPQGRKVGPDSARRVIEVLFTFTGEQPELTVREIAAKVGIPLPSAHRYVALLREEHLLAEGDRGTYHLTWRVNGLTRAARAAHGLIDVADGHMRQLSERIGETVLLAQLVHGLPVCTHRVETSRRLRLSFEPGQNLPPLRGASVKILVGTLAESERRAYLDRVLAAGSEGDRSRSEFLAEIDRARDQGWAASTQEIDEGVWAVAAPVREGSEVVASLSAACPAFRLDDERRAFVRDHVRVSARQISDQLSGLTT